MNFRKYCVFALFFSICPLLNAQSSNFVKNGYDAFYDYLAFYQKFISASRTSYCPMHPSCSNYAMECFRHYHAGKAFLMTSDRLMRCGRDLQHYNKIKVNNRIKFNDPVSLNYTNIGIQSEKKTSGFRDTIMRDSETDFIRYLIDQELYDEAIIEINRFLYQGSTDKLKLYQLYFYCLNSTDRFDKSVSLYEKVKDSLELNVNSLFTVGSAYEHLKNYNAAVNIYGNITDIPSISPYMADSASVKIALTYIKRLDWQNSRNQFLTIGSESVFNLKINKSLEDIKMAENARYKNPLLAGCLGIVPGMGYLYTGHGRTAFAAFVINGLMMYATYSSIRNENYGMAALVGSFSVSFYLANIFGSARTARRYNHNLRVNYANRILNHF